jgi:hypothetical protein
MFCQRTLCKQISRCLGLCFFISGLPCKQVSRRPWQANQSTRWLIALKSRRLDKQIGRRPGLFLFVIGQQAPWPMCLWYWASLQANQQASLPIFSFSGRPGNFLRVSCVSGLLGKHISRCRGLCLFSSVSRCLGECHFSAGALTSKSAGALGFVLQQAPSKANQQAVLASKSARALACSFGGSAP